MSRELPHHEEVDEALDHLVLALAENAQRLKTIAARVSTMRESRDKGLSYREIEEQSSGPRVLELLSMNLIVLQEAVKQFRRTETRALRSQGLTLQEIARLFGVSHQRVWSLLKDEPAFGEEADAG